MDSGGGALHLPPGFRFHPTDDELVRHYLLRKCGGGAPAAPVIAEVDLYKFDPWQLPAKSLVGEKEWYFFSPRDRKYPNGSRPNRAAGTGYWKATGADKPVGAPRAVAIKKALVFYAGKPPKGVKTNWIMHEYRLADVDRSAAARKRTSSNNNALRLDDWVLCRIYNKKGVIERYDTVDDDEVMMTNKPPVAAKNNNNNARGGHAAAAPAPAMKVEMHDYDGYYAAVDDYDMPEAAEMLCFDRPFQPPPPLSSSGDRDSGDDNSVPRLLHTDNSSSGSEHVLSPSPDLPDRDRDHAESQPIMAGGGGWFDGCWGGDGAVHGDGFVVDCSVGGALFGSMPSPGGFASARDAAALGELFAYLQRPF